MDGYGGTDDEPVYGSSAEAAWDKIVPLRNHSKRSVPHAATRHSRASTTYDSAPVANPHQSDFHTTGPAAQVCAGGVDQSPVRHHCRAEVTTGESRRR